MFGLKKPEVLVLGAGPVGLFAALALVRRGVKVQIVDRGHQLCMRSYALGLHPGSMRLLDQYGLLGEVLETAHRVHRVVLFRGGVRAADLRLSELPAEHPFVAVLRQDELEQVLENALRKAGVAVKWSHEVTQLTPREDGVTARVDRWNQDTGGYSVQHSEWVLAGSSEKVFPFVVGADGHSSVVRRSLAAGFPQVGQTEDFAVFEFRSDADLHHEMRLTLGQDDTNVLWPLGDGYCRWSFQIPSHDSDSDTREKNRDVVMPGEGDDRDLTADHLRELIKERAPWFTGSVDHIRWSMFVRFERRLADSFGQGRMWLAGDAAHVTGPAGVHSMNVGLREADDLAARLADVVQGRAPASTLEAYGEQRRAEWRQLLGLDGGLRAEQTTDSWIAASRHRLLPCIPATGADLEHLAAQIGLVAGQPARQPG